MNDQFHAIVGEPLSVLIDRLPRDLWPEDAKPGDTFVMRLQPTIETLGKMDARGEF